MLGNGSEDVLNDSDISPVVIFGLEGLWFSRGHLQFLQTFLEKEKCMCKLCVLIYIPRSRIELNLTESVFIYQNEFIAVLNIQLL